MLRKFFPLDKNYVLEQVQLSVEQSLLQYLIDFVKVEYLLRCNPLGIADDASVKIQSHTSDDFTQLHEFYLNLAGVYRYTYYHDNQLQFSFDGRDDFEIYSEQWERTYRNWVRDFCRKENFIKAILELTVFYPEAYTPQMAGLRLSAFISKAFEVKIDPNKGIVKMKVA